GEDSAPQIPLDVRGTAFQRRVWSALQRIPRGTTLTYSEVAQRIGQPTAVRAVARACATNPAALVIPCHRVVRADDGLGGYRWGIARKGALLEQERVTTTSLRPRLLVARLRGKVYVHAMTPSVFRAVATCVVPEAGGL